VTAAALLFTVAIGAFASSKIVFIKQLGTALAVLIDASIVRALLVPSLTALLGSANGGPQTPTVGPRALWPAGPRQPPARGLQLTEQAPPAGPAR
jgi:uncharacterized membrane protein YdfJ with MMPL/SSD domain